MLNPELSRKYSAEDTNQYTIGHTECPEHQRLLVRRLPHQSQIGSIVQSMLFTNTRVMRCGVRTTIQESSTVRGIQTPDLVSLDLLIS